MPCHQENTHHSYTYTQTEPHHAQVQQLREIMFFSHTNTGRISGAVFPTETLQCGTHFEVRATFQQPSHLHTPVNKHFDNFTQGDKICLVPKRHDKLIIFCMFFFVGAFFQRSYLGLCGQKYFVFFCFQKRKRMAS